jgi:hypothetical protein
MVDADALLPDDEEDEDEEVDLLERLDGQVRVATGV